jgi:hypothetical protein
MTKAEKEKKKCIEHHAEQFSEIRHLVDSARHEIVNVITSASAHARLRKNVDCHLFTWLDLMEEIATACEVYEKQCKSGRLYQ